MATRRFKKRTCLLISCIFLELQGQQRNKTMSRLMIHTYVTMTFMYIQPSSVSTVSVYITDRCPKASVYTAKMFTIRLNLNLDLHLNDVAGA